MLITSAGELSSLPQEADITAYQKPEVIVPNVISPNGDGRNDALDLETLSINISIESVTIYDSSGALVFESSAATLKWDGRDRFGEACAEGNYVCIYQALGIDQKPYVGREIVRVER
jgi:gliding motility-associated-like protein